MFYTEIFHDLQKNKKRIQTPYPESKDTQKNLVDEVRGSKGRQNNAGGAGISFSFSSVPRRRLI